MSVNIAITKMSAMSQELLFNNFISHCRHSSIVWDSDFVILAWLFHCMLKLSDASEQHFCRRNKTKISVPKILYPHFSLAMSLHTYASYSI